MFRSLLSVIIFLMAFSAHAEMGNHIKVCYLEWGKQGGEHLPDQGFNPDLFTQVLKEAGYTSEVKIMPWKRCLLHVEKGSYDMVAGLWIDDNNKKKFDFFHHVSIDEISFMSLKDLKATSGRLEDFYGKTIGILRGAGGMDMLDPKKFKVKILADDNQMIENLLYKRVDAIVSNTVHLNSVIEGRYPELLGKTKVWTPAIKANISAPAVSVNHPKKDELKQKFNSALEKLTKEGLYERLFKKHNIVIKYEE
jgi:polar amino acid transport system substrate-binding protein